MPEAIELSQQLVKPDDHYFARVELPTYVANGDPRLGETILQESLVPDVLRGLTVVILGRRTVMTGAAGAFSVLSAIQRHEGRDIIGCITPGEQQRDFLEAAALLEPDTTFVLKEITELPIDRLYGRLQKKPKR